MLKKIKKIKENFSEEIKKATQEKELADLRVKYLGKKSEFNQLLKNLKNLPLEKKREVGSFANVTKKKIYAEIEKKISKIENMENAKMEWIDVTAPGKKIRQGHLHPLSIVQRDIEDIFTTMGFEIADGPEVDSEYYNFDAINMPADHPARDMQDTFWISKEADRKKGEGVVLRTQTSNVQVQYMQKHKPPLRVIAPGRVFRSESTDASHEHTFHQFEALVVGDDISVANFLYIAETFFSKFFEKKLKIRLRPSYFPFVEPGFEFDVSCTKCNGRGCSICSQTGWIEVGGAGMVHQNVFETAGYTRGKYQGFAWGFGLERLAMMKYKIDDIRLFHGGDIRFTKQF